MNAEDEQELLRRIENAPKTLKEAIALGGCYSLCEDEYCTCPTAFYWLNREKANKPRPDNLTVCKNCGNWYCGRPYALCGE